MVSIDLGLRLLLIPLLVLQDSQLFAAALELFRPLRLARRLVLGGKPLDCDARVQAIGIAAGEGRILVALENHAVESDPVLHEVGHRHGRDLVGAARRHAQYCAANQRARDGGFDGGCHIRIMVPKTGRKATRPAVTCLTTWVCSALETGSQSRFVLPPQQACVFDPVRRHVYRLRMPTQKAPNEAAPDFELAMRDLEELVERLEQGDLPLEESLAAFERGVMLTRTCQTALKEAEQKVEILLKKAGETAVEEFSPEDTKAG